jgi:hypothetical protein
MLIMKGRQKLINFSIQYVLKPIALLVLIHEKFRYDDSAHVSTMAVGSLGKRSREESLSDGGAVHISGPVSSDDSPQFLYEDLLRNNDSRATGFVGQNSEVQWLRDLKTQIGSRASEGWERPYGHSTSYKAATRRRLCNEKMLCILNNNHPK